MSENTENTENTENIAPGENDVPLDGVSSGDEPQAEPLAEPITKGADPKPLTVSELARQLGVEPWNMNRSAILRFETDPDVPHILGKHGDVYPPESLALWQKIALARAAKPPLVKPETTAHFLREILNDPIKLRRVDAHIDAHIGDTNGLSGNRIADNGQNGALALPGADPGAMLAVLENTIERAAAYGAERGVAAGIKQAASNFLPPRTNRLLTLKEAREQTGLSESTIKRLAFVQETGAGGRRKWKWSVLQDAVDAL